jgi:hypothetical protein
MNWACQNRHLQLRYGSRNGADVPGLTAAERMGLLDDAGRIAPIKVWDWVI